MEKKFEVGDFVCCKALKHNGLVILSIDDNNVYKCHNGAFTIAFNENELTKLDVNSAFAIEIKRRVKELNIK